MSADRGIPFNTVALTGRELDYISEALTSGKLSGDGPFTRRCNAWLERASGAGKALLTHSCTAALEMAALLLELLPGDEIIMPSYTFVSTANAFVLRGAVPVFVDIRPDTLNLDERLIESAITPRTRAIVPVHYAGVACAMDEILAIAARHGLPVIEDAAQAVGSRYRGRPLGSLGQMAAYSFHETKNIVSGEGGALLVNGDAELIQRAEIIREKGTNRSRFLRGEVDKYTWQDVGSSYLPSELIAAFLWAQLEEMDSILQRRMAVWRRYHAGLEPLEDAGKLRRPIVPIECEHNAHMYYVIVSDALTRDRLIDAMRQRGIQAPFHYVPLHSAPAGQRFGRAAGDMELTNDLSARLIRLPLSADLSAADQARIIEAIGTELH